ncbi:MAG: hypothetical protein JOZ51_23080 [Chloroflexi bacterium]|nr:hypothetical protein [Chloroflexota bacterium]
MRLNHPRRFQIAMVGLTVVCALVAGYITAVIAGGGAGQRASTTAGLPPINPAATVEAETASPIAQELAETPEATTAPTPSSTPAPTPTTQSTPQPQQTVFINETFEGEDAGWPNGETETWSAGFVDGRYRLRLNGQTSIGFTTPISVDNYRLSVDLAVAQGGAGLVFLFTEPATSYRIIVSEGAFAVERQEGNATTQENIVTKIVDWTESPALQKDAGAVNRLTIERQGEKVYFLANDQPLSEFAVPPGPFVNRYGFVLTSRTGQGEATFDNLRGEELPDS